MATYGELVSGVLDIIDVPEKERLVRRKLNQLIRHISSSGFYRFDLREEVVDGLDPTLAIHNLTADTSVRALLYVRYPDPDYPTIKVVSAQEAISLANCNQDQDIAYIGASSIHVKVSKETTSLLLGYYTFPQEFAIDGSDDNSSNWVTDRLPHVLEDLAASYIMNLVGHNEDSKRVSDLAATFNAAAIRDLVQEVLP